MELRRACSQATSQSLGACSNDTALTERIKKVRYMGNEMDGVGADYSNIKKLNLWLTAPKGALPVN